MRHFYENCHFKNKASVALNMLVSLFYLFVARSGRKRGNRRTDRPSTVTLAVHVRAEGYEPMGGCSIVIYMSIIMLGKFQGSY